LKSNYAEFSEWLADRLGVKIVAENINLFENGLVDSLLLVEMTGLIEALANISIEFNDETFKTMSSLKMIKTTYFTEKVRDV
jgi:acyl carrier protein